MVVRAICPSSKKQCYSSAASALRYAGRLVQKYRAPIMRTYLCKDCRSYHLTHLTYEQYNEVVDHKDATEFRDFLGEIVKGVKQWRR